MSISGVVLQCLAKFKTLEANGHDHVSLLDENGRFRVWTGNISAHRTGRRSLEYRLRDSSNLQSTVISLLRDLLQALDRYEEVDTKAEHDNAKPTNQLPANNGSDRQSAVGTDDEDDVALFGLEDDDDRAYSSTEKALEEIHEINSCLLRFSMALRNPARHDQIKQAASTTTIHFEPYDMEHVRQKFPNAECFLHERLGKFISKHRQYYKYREEHHFKLTEGLDGEKKDAEERPSTIATSVQKTDVATPAPVTYDVGSDTESVYSATSFAPTTAGEKALRPPPLPEAGQDGEPFECPLCYRIITAENERSWR